MTPDQDPIVDDLVDAVTDFVVSLRSNEGFDEVRYDRLVWMLRRCADAWRDSDRIPRKAVNALVDLQPAATAAADAYRPEERDRILDRVVRLGDEVRDVVAL
jgi:hypothetical protein